MAFDFTQFERCRVLVVGDLMIDEYVWGDSDRISPEAPVPVVNVRREEYTLGGSGNVIHNLRSLGVDVCAAGVVGDDPHGRILTGLLTDLAVDINGVVTVSERPTTQKTRIIAGSQHVLRIDREDRVDIRADTIAGIGRWVNGIMSDVDAVVLSDYGKGLLTPNLIREVITAAEAHGKPTVVDPKGLDFTRYAGATVITPNRKEAGLASGMTVAHREDLIRAGESLMAAASGASVLITCGKDGMALLQGGSPPVWITAETRQVYDVSGAGDTVVAVLAATLAGGGSLETGARLANTAAGIVVGKVGTATVTVEEMRQVIAPGHYRGAEKIVTLEALPDRIRALKKAGKTIVLTNGCFDLLHAGHLHLFAESRRMGDALVVAIDDDASVEKLKGAGRPIIGQTERLRTLSALDSIDLVVVFASEALPALLESVQPDILTKGSNYGEDEVAGREIVEAHGGRVVRIPISDTLSTSRIIDQIRNAST